MSEGLVRPSSNGLSDEPQVLSSAISSSYEGRNILITGGRGFIGAALTEYLSGVNCSLLIVDRSAGKEWVPVSRRAKIALVNKDVSQRETWESILPEIDYVFHLAGLDYFHRSEYDAELDFQVNALSVLHLVDVCLRNNFKPRVVFTSSANLFGTVDRLPVNEDFRDNPLTVWAVHKLMAEKYLSIYSQEHGLQTLILRLANVYGPTPHRALMSNVTLNKIMIQALAGKPLLLYRNCDCIRDFIFLDDVVRALLLAGALECPSKNCSYVIGSGEGRTVRDVWQAIAQKAEQLTGRSVPIEVSNSVRLGPSETRNFVADATRFRDATGWRPLIDLSSGIDRTLRVLGRSAAQGGNLS